MSDPSVSGLLCGRQILRRERRLPVDGEVFVRRGDPVTSRTVLAAAEQPGGALSVRAAALLNLSPRELMRAMRVELGAQVEQGTLLAASCELLGLVRREVRSPCRGAVEAISNVTGIVRLREAPARVELLSYLPGVVVEILPRRGAVIEAEVELVQGIFGLGPEHIGTLQWLVDDPERSAEPDALDEAHRDAVVVVGRCASAELLMRARDIGVGAVVAGSAAGQAIVALAGRPINPAVTVDEKRRPTVVLTEGFGDLAMGQRVFSHLYALSGRVVSVNGATQIRAGVLRPEIVAEAEGGELVESIEKDPQWVRIVRGEHFGKTGVIVSRPAQAVEIGSGVRCLVWEVELLSGQRIAVPRPNVERL